jgi:hypothetical protein
VFDELLAVTGERRMLTVWVDGRIQCLVSKVGQVVLGCIAWEPGIHLNPDLGWSLLLWGHVDSTTTEVWRRTMVLEIGGGSERLGEKKVEWFLVVGERRGERVSTCRRGKQSRRGGLHIREQQQKLD